MTTFYQFVKFNLVGGLNTALTYGIYASLLGLGTHHMVALGGDYAFGIVFSFIMNLRFTFRVKTEKYAVMFLRMLMTYLPLLALNALLLWLCVDLLSWNKYLSQALCAAFVALISFTAQRTFVFRAHRTESHGA